jgi:hypothetical protein
MVYERIPIEVELRKFDKHLSHEVWVMCGIVDRTVFIGILATCRQVFEEAKDVMRAKTRDIVAIPPLLIVGKLDAVQYMSCF